MISKEKLIKYAQWLTFILLATACFCLWHKTNNNLISDTQYNKNETQYVSISSDKSLSELKKENQILYDSLKKISNVKEAIQIRYITSYSTDTVFVGKNIQAKDSTYHYSHNSDTIKYNLDINGNNVKWFKLNFALQDSLMIITRSNNGQNETTITHSNNTTVDNVTVYTPKRTFKEKLKEKFYVGVGVGAGYGFFSKKPDIYIGINAGIKF